MYPPLSSQIVGQTRPVLHPKNTLGTLGCIRKSESESVCGTVTVVVVDFGFLCCFGCLRRRRIPPRRIRYENLPIDNENSGSNPNKSAQTLERPIQLRLQSQSDPKVSSRPRAYLKVSPLSDLFTIPTILTNLYSASNYKLTNHSPLHKQIGTESNLTKLLLRCGPNLLTSNPNKSTKQRPFRR